MTTRKKSKTDAVPAIGDRLLTPREAADVLRLSSRTMREYVQRGEMGGESSAGGGDLGVQTLTPSLQTLPVTGTSLEKTATGIRWWSADKVRTISWRCRSCARLRYSSEGGYLRPSGLGRLGQLGVMLRAYGKPATAGVVASFRVHLTREAAEASICELSSVSRYGKR